MAFGRSLHLGIDENDPNHYAGLKTLRGAEHDARSMAQIARAQGFTARLMLGSQATLAAVRDELAEAASALQAGDTFLLTYAGHGGIVPDTQREGDVGVDETWCLHDQQLIGNLFYTDLCGFRPGVTLVIVGDTCYSGSAARSAFYQAIRRVTALGIIVGEEDTRALPPDLASSIYLANQASYDAWCAQARKDARKAVRASALFLAACQDLQEAKDGAFHGRFTSALLTVWNGGKYLSARQATYADFLRRIGVLMADPTQVPRLFQVGTETRDLRERKPFVIEATRNEESPRPRR